MIENYEFNFNISSSIVFEKILENNKISIKIFFIPKNDKYIAGIEVKSEKNNFNYKIEYCNIEKEKTIDKFNFYKNIIINYLKLNDDLYNFIEKIHKQII